MIKDGKRSGLAQLVFTEWYGYLLIFGSLVLTFLFIGLGLVLNQTTLIVVGLIFLASALFLLVLILWLGQQMTGVNRFQDQEFLYDMSQASPTDHLAYIDLGLRQGALVISRQLTSGRLTVVDVYNPQQMKRAALEQARRQAPSAQADPRIHWYDSPIDLLPLPDKNVSAIFIPHILSQINQHGDRMKLLGEVHRILKPNGRLLVAETVRVKGGQFRFFPMGGEFHPITYWQSLLKDAGFEIRRVEILNGMNACVRADKPSPFAGRQMPLDLRFDQKN